MKATGIALNGAAPNVDYSFIIPTYRRPDVLDRCLQRLVELRKENASIEVRVYDNGAPDESRPTVEAFAKSLPVTYTLNEAGHGLGYSLQRGSREVSGAIVIELNDDALVPADFLERIDSLFASDPTIGVVGVRAIESDYETSGKSIGVIDRDSLSVVGNFTRETSEPIDVEHVYGFCYAYRKQLLERGGWHDRVLLARDYSNGNRIETDHCLTARRIGYRVVYDGSIAVEHLAKPRADVSELSMRWKINSTRNTLYLYLKHFGWFGRGGLAARFAFLHDLGLRSLIKRPNTKNFSYFCVGIWARVSAVGHWLAYLATAPRHKPLMMTSEVEH